MSFGFSFIGKRDAVKKAVAEAKGYGDTTQHDAAKALIIGQLDALPENIGVSVSASGHHDYGAKPPYGNMEMKLTFGVNIVE